MKMLLVIALCLSLVGCATGYQKVGLMGGYTDMKIQDNIYKVSFRGNAHVSEERAYDFALLRCAELTIENGYRYFVPVQEKSSVKESSYTEPVTAQTTGTISAYGNSGYAYGSFNGATNYYGGQTYHFRKPKTIFTIACFKDKPENIPTMVYDAEQVRDNIKKNYNLK